MPSVLPESASGWAQGFQLVHAFEPSPDTWQCFKANLVEEIASGKVMGHQEALGENLGKAVVVDDVTRMGNTGSRFITFDMSKTGPEVAVNRLDSLNLDRLDFLKLDVEGAEALVLKGGFDIIIKHKPLIYIEQKKGATLRFGPVDGEARRILHKWGARRMLKLKNDHVYVWP